MTTRRDLLSQMAAGVSALAISPAFGEAVTPPSLAVLYADLQAAQADQDVAYAEWERLSCLALERAGDPPAVLKFSPFDGFGVRPQTRWLYNGDGEISFYGIDSIRVMRRGRYARRTQEHADRVIAAFDEWQREREAADVHFGVEAAWERVHELGDARDVIRSQILAYPAATIADLAIKAKVIAVLDDMDDAEGNDCKNACAFLAEIIRLGGLS